MARTARRDRGDEARLVDQFFFIFSAVAAVWLSYLFIREGVRPGWPMLLVIAFWVTVAYLALPRVHRILTSIYVPDYFIGRTRTADGLLGDPVNIAFRGSARDVHEAMQRAGWTLADDLSTRTGLRIVHTTLTRRSYAEAPVSALFLFRRRQDFAYEQEVDGNPSQRHHVRFWATPRGWPLPGGFTVDWLAAATYDRAVGLSLFTFQVTHKIDPNVDVERDHVVDTVRAANASATVEVIKDFSTGYHSRNGGGDRISTDGDLPIVNLAPTLAAGSNNAAIADVTDVGTALAPVGAARVPAEGRRATRRRPPAQTMFGAVTAAARGCSYFAISALAGMGAAMFSSEGDMESALIMLGLVAVAAVAGVFDLLLAAATWRGHNWSRILLLAGSVIGTVTVFSERLVTGVEGPGLGLVTVTISVLTLLALSSDPARTYARRGRPERAALTAGPQEADRPQLSG